MINHNKSSLLSMILLSYYSEERIEKSYNEVACVLDKANIPFEFIIIDDGSNDSSYNTALMLEKKLPRVRAYQLSKNYTSHYSIFAGLSLCNGACAMPIPDDEQQPYSTIVEMYRLWQNGNKIIIPYRQNRDDPFLSKFLSNSFYCIMNAFSEIKFPLGGADLFFIDREIIDIINNQISTTHTSSVTEVLRLGYSPYYYPYHRGFGLNKKKSRWSFKKKVLLAKDIFYSSSSFPIRLINITGLTLFVISLTIMFIYIYAKVFGDNNFWGNNVPGWTSIIVIMLFFGSMTMLSLGVIAEYIWRIYEEVKGRPSYIIKQKDDKENDKK